MHTYVYLCLLNILFTDTIKKIKHMQRRSLHDVENVLETVLEKLLNGGSFYTLVIYLCYT